MKLQEDPFERIKNGTKTVEFRLYDEKRQTIQIGDEIEFSKLPELQEKLKSYDTLYEKYQSDYNFTINDSFVTNYNALVNKYKTYEESLKDTEIKNPIVGYPKLMRIYFDTIDIVQLLRNKLMPPVDKPDNIRRHCGGILFPGGSDRKQP